MKDKKDQPKVNRNQERIDNSIQPLNKREQTKDFNEGYVPNPNTVVSAIPPKNPDRKKK